MRTSTELAPRPNRLRDAVDWIGESLYVADLTLLGLVAFLFVLGAINPFDSLLVPVALAVTFVLSEARRRGRRRRNAEAASAANLARERRGF
jgi:hypothetical protein